MKITKEWLQEQDACMSGVRWFLNQDKTDSVDVLKALIKDDKAEDANWLIVRVMTRPQYLAYAIYAAEQVIDIFEKQYPNDDRPRKAIEAAKAVLANDTQETRDAARDAAGAAGAARAARAAGAAWAAGAAGAAGAAWAAARAARAAWAAGDAEDTMRLKILNYGIGLLEEAKV